ncbi:hypothetical protein S83_055173, partial [Arachis hypogaea]
TTLKCKMGLFTYIQIKTVNLYCSCISKKLEIVFPYLLFSFPIWFFGVGQEGLQRISADSCFTSWRWSMCWNNCHVRNLSNGYGSRQDNCTGSIVGLNFAVYESLKDCTFRLKVASFPFDDHNCPPLQLVISFCHSAYSWLKLDIENVVVVHCKAGTNKVDDFYSFQLLRSQWITIIRNDVLMEKDLFCPVR